MSKALIPSQPTVTEIASVLRTLWGKHPELHRVASEAGNRIEFWPECGDTAVRLECEYNYNVMDSRSHYAPVGGLLLKSTSGQSGHETVSAIARSFGGYVLDQTDRNSIWVEVKRQGTTSHSPGEMSRIAIERCLSADEALALSGLLGDVRRLSDIVPLLARHAMALDPLSVEIRQADIVIGTIEAALLRASPGKYRGVDARGLSAPADCIDFAVVSDGTGKEVSRVWTEEDARYQLATQPETILDIIEAYRQMTAWNHALVSEKPHTDTGD